MGRHLRRRSARPACRLPTRRQSATSAVALRRAARPRSRERARLVAVELERREEAHVLDRAHVPVGHEQRGQLGERLDAHDAGQHRRAVDPVVVEEGLLAGRAWSRPRARCATPMPTTAPIIGPRPRDGAALRRVEPAGRVELLEQDAEPPRDHHLAARAAARELAPHDRDRRPPAAACRSPPRHHLSGSSRATPCRCRPTPSSRWRSRASPGRVVRSFAIALAEQVVGGAVVGLAAVAEAAGDRAEDDGGAERHVAGRVQRG